MYVADDPRAKLQSSAGSGAGAGGPARSGPEGGPRFAPAQYASFADAPPQQSSAVERTW